MTTAVIPAADVSRNFVVDEELERYGETVDQVLRVFNEAVLKNRKSKLYHSVDILDELRVPCDVLQRIVKEKIVQAGYLNVQVDVTSLEPEPVLDRPVFCFQHSAYGHNLEYRLKPRKKHICCYVLLGGWSVDLLTFGAAYREYKTLQKKIKRYHQKVEEMKGRPNRRLIFSVTVPTTDDRPPLYNKLL